MSSLKAALSDVDALRICEIKKYRVQELTRSVISDFSGDVSDFSGTAFPGEVFSGILTLQDRLPILDLHFEVESDLPCRVKILDSVLFPETATLYPDIISERLSCNVGGNQTAGFLVECEIPPASPAALYPVKILAESSTHKVCEINFILEVIAVSALPDLPDFITIFWPHWEVFCRQLKLELWSEPFWVEAEKYLKAMAAGGMNSAMASICHDPFRYPLPPEYYAYNHYPAMIKWYKKNQVWSFDYSIYDRYIELNHKLGIDREIECHSMLPCKNQPPYLSYFDENNNFISIESRYDAPEYIEAWTAFLTDFARHNASRNWLNLLTICPYDEPTNPESFRFAADLVKKIAPEIRITAAISSVLANNVKDCIDIATLHLSANYDEELKKDLENSGIELGWYNCCAPDWGNTLFKCALEEAYRQSWIGYAHKFRRFLRWSIIDWPPDVMHQSGFNWPSGDTHLLYPGFNGPLESLRWRSYKTGRSDLRRLLACRAQADTEKIRRIDEFIMKLGRFGKVSSAETIGNWRHELGLILKGAI